MAVLTQHIPPATAQKTDSRLFQPPGTLPPVFRVRSSARQAAAAARCAKKKRGYEHTCPAQPRNPILFASPSACFSCLTPPFWLPSPQTSIGEFFSHPRGSGVSREGNRNFQDPGGGGSRP